MDSVEQVQYDIGGLSCSFCAETINKAVGGLEGVEEVNVSLAHEEVMVRYNTEEVNEVEVKDTLRELGYTIRDPDKQKRFEEQQEELDTGRERLLISASASILGFAMMALMVYQNNWNIFAETEKLWMWYGSLGLALITMFWPGLYIKKKAYNSLKRGIFNQHVLLEAGAFAGLVGGFLGWFVFQSFPVVHFFLVSTFITTYHILSEYTSLIVRTRASRAVQGLMDLQPDTARRVTEEGEIEEVEVGRLEEGDQVRVKPGENIPIDGKVLEGSSAVDESVATGESAPVDKKQGDEVIGGSVNQTGTLLVKVTATGGDAFLNQVAQQIEEARAMKPGIVKLADRVLKYFVPGVLTVAAASFTFWTVVPAVFPGTFFGTGPQFQTAAFAALAALVLGYPCALGMVTPLALIRGGGEAAKNGILMRSGDAFQIYRQVKTIVLDKTGTITEGKPAVDTVTGINRNSEDEVLEVAATAESFSEHPLAQAILEHAEEQGIKFSDPDEFNSVTGKGVKATLEDKELLVGKPGWLIERNIDLSEAEETLEQLQKQGLTTVGVAKNGRVIGLIGIGDEIKKDAAETVERMKDAGIEPVIITGDNERTAQAVAEEVRINRVMAEVLPDDKRDEIQRLQNNENERVAMVGDGINDAPALTQSDVGIAIGAGTDIAIESADIVLMGDRLEGVMDSYEIAETSYRKTWQNLIGAFSFNGIGVAAATTGVVHPVFAMIAMVASVSAVLANSFAGQLIAGEEIKTDFSIENSKQEKEDTKGETMEKITFSANLHCKGCEKRVTEELSEKEGVTEVEADSDNERVEVDINTKLVDKENLQNSISEMGYEVEEVKP